MICCGEEKEFNFDNLYKLFDYDDEYKKFKGLGRQSWPVLYYKDNGLEPVVMIHAPVGTDLVFKDTQYRVIISGFCTSLQACLGYLKEHFLKNESNLDNLEFNYTFFSEDTGLRGNLIKIYKKIGLLDMLGVNFQNTTKEEFKKLLSLIKQNPTKYPLLMTQALCFIGTPKRSDADSIKKLILGKSISSEHKKWVVSNLNNWLTKITKNKSDNCVLLLLGYRKDNKQAIKKLLESTRIIDGNVYLGSEKNRISLLGYVRELFDDRVVFVPHPSQLSDTYLNRYLKSPEGEKCKMLLSQIK